MCESLIVQERYLRFHWFNFPRKSDVPDNSQLLVWTQLQIIITFGISKAHKKARGMDTEMELCDGGFVDDEDWQWDLIIKLR